MWMVYVVAESSGAAGVSVIDIESVDQDAVQGTSAPVASPLCSVTYVAIPRGIARSNPMVTTAPRLTADAPPAGLTATREVLGRGDRAVETWEHPAAMTVGTRTVKTLHAGRDIHASLDRFFGSLSACFGADVEGLMSSSSWWSATSEWSPSTGWRP
jgi:hypothetical protein